MFGRIARRYDRANRVLSLGIDRYWRFKLVQAVKVKASHAVLDLATGSGDVAFSLAERLPAAIPIVG
ncbi:MAG TPA: class I SAM-dependent methyltransferase, partial [Opitutaceae bacterium]